MDKTQLTLLNPTSTPRFVGNATDNILGTLQNEEIKK